MPNCPRQIQSIAIRISKIKLRLALKLTPTQMLSTNQLLILWTLREKDYRPLELSKKMATNAANLSQSIKTLGEMGFIHKTSGFEDKRKVVISISPDGQRILQRSKLETEDRYVTAFICFKKKLQVALTNLN
jgi:DNA-binding MarR family transcriptional regulator